LAIRLAARMIGVRSSIHFCCLFFLFFVFSPAPPPPLSPLGRVRGWLSLGFCLTRPGKSPPGLCFDFFFYCVPPPLTQPKTLVSSALSPPVFKRRPVGVLRGLLFTLSPPCSLHPLLPTGRKITRFYLFQSKSPFFPFRTLDWFLPHSSTLFGFQPGPPCFLIFSMSRVLQSFLDPLSSPLSRSGIQGRRAICFWLSVCLNFFLHRG